MLQLPSVPVHGAVSELVRLARSDRFTAHAVRGSTSPFLLLASSEHAFEATLARLQGKFRANLRRRLRKLQAKGVVSLVRTITACDQLQRFYELEQAGWKGRQHTAILGDVRTRRYYDVLATEAERFGYLSLYSLKCGDETVAMHYGLTHRGRYFILKTAYDEAFAECSPGQLLMLEVVRDLTARGCVEIDFLGLSVDWNREWSPQLRPHADWSVFRGPCGALAHLVNARARRIVGRLVRRYRPRRQPGGIAARLQL